MVRRDVLTSGGRKLGRAHRSWLGVVGGLVACGGTRVGPAPTATRPAVLAPATDRAPTAPALKTTPANAPLYVVDASNLERLLVRVSFSQPLAGALRVIEGAEPFVSEAEVRTAAGAWPLDHDGQGFTTTHCAAGCEVSYAFALGDAARKLADAELAEPFASAVIAPSSSWLLGVPGQAGYLLEVHAQAPNRFLTAFPPLDPDRGDGKFASAAAPIFAPFAAFGAWRALPLRVSEAHVTVGITGAPYATPDAELARWIEQTLTPMADYYGGLPALYPLILVVPGDRGIHGVTLGNGGSSVLLRVGREVTAAAALDAWVPTHEFTHVLFPSVAPRLPWIEEGLATYVEPVIRARAGRISVERFWTDLLEGLPQGLPRQGDRGLDQTPTWGRTYWGGALYWLLADVRIRERTHNQRSIRDALIAILHAGGNVSVDWSLDRILSVADAACGGREFREAHAQMGRTPWAPDLKQLFAALGVSQRGRRIVFDDSARLAGVRAAITGKPSP